MRHPRVAYFPDSFHEVNGVAHTSRNFVAYAQRHDLPFLCIRAGNRSTPFEQDGNLRTLELPRSAASVGMEKDLAFDPLFWRHADLIEAQLRSFRPDLLHMTGPSELGIFAAYFSWKLRIPLVASWHTNIHEYAGRRLNWLTSLMPTDFAKATRDAVEGTTLDISMWFYSLARALFAPNHQLCQMIASATKRPCHLMQRGVDTSIFSPWHRTRNESAHPATPASPFILGFVGRLSIEKNVALLPHIQRALDAAGIPTRFLIIGHGSEEESLRRELPTAQFTGVLRGAELSRAYANMDLFIFPSHTDTFGNVVLEALSSGVPAVVTPHGGPRFIVTEGETGAIANDDQFPNAIAKILSDPNRLQAMRAAARKHALKCSWDAVFDQVYAAYRPLLCDITGSGASSSPGWSTVPTYTPYPGSDNPPAFTTAPPPNDIASA
jgi:glycosyltransferase involved in cell wall biosynthesis